MSLSGETSTNFKHKKLPAKSALLGCLQLNPPRSPDTPTTTTCTLPHSTFPWFLFLHQGQASHSPSVDQIGFPNATFRGTIMLRSSLNLLRLRTTVTRAIARQPRLLQPDHTSTPAFRSILPRLQQQQQQHCHRRTFHSTPPRRDVFFFAFPALKGVLLNVTRVSLIALPFVWRWR